MDKKIVFVILFSLLCSTAFAYIDKPKDAWHKFYHVNYDHFLNFSETKNIIIMVIDGARGVFLSKCFPNYRKTKSLHLRIHLFPEHIRVFQ